MSVYKEQLLAKLDQLTAEADQLPEGDQRQQLIKQIAALNAAIAEHSKD